MTSDRPYAQRFRGTLGTPPSLDKGQLLTEALRNAPAEQLDADLREYLKQPTRWLQHHSEHPPQVTVQERELDETEILLLWARLQPDSEDGAAAALKRLDAAVERSPAESATWFWRGRYRSLHGDAEQAEKDFEKALSLSPGNPEYLYGLLHHRWRGGDKPWPSRAQSGPVLETIQALASQAQTAYQFNALAAHQLVSQNYQAAAASSAEATRLEPGCWICFHNRALAQYARGDARQARRFEEEALSRLPDGATGDLLKLANDALEFYAEAQVDLEAARKRPTPAIIRP